MFDNKTKVLLILPQDILDRARVFAGETTTKLKSPVSLQMVLRALIDEGLKRRGDQTILANVAGQVQAVRRIRSRLSRVTGAGKEHRAPRPPIARSGRGAVRQRGST